MKLSLWYKLVMQIVWIPATIGLSVLAFHAVLPGHLNAEEAGAPLPEFYRGLLSGYYVELVVDWLPDKRVEGEIWTAAHRVTPDDLGFVFAKVQGENEQEGYLEIEIVGDEIDGQNGPKRERLGVAFLKKRLTEEYIEWEGEYKRPTGEKTPMIIYRERRYSLDTGGEVGNEEDEGPSERTKYKDTESCEARVCAPVVIDICVDKARAIEAREYFDWLKFPVKTLCGTLSGGDCSAGPLCGGELWELEVDGFSEPYWEQELENLPFIVSARRRAGGGGDNTGIIEMPIASFFSDTVPDHEEAVLRVSEFMNEYFSGALRSGDIAMTMKQRTRFNFMVDIEGASPWLSLRKPGLREYHQMVIMMSQPYPYDPEKFAIYIGLPSSRYGNWTEKGLMAGTIMNIESDAPHTFLEKVVSAFAHRYRATVWTP